MFKRPTFYSTYGIRMNQNQYLFIVGNLYKEQHIAFSRQIFIQFCTGLKQYVT